MKRDLNTYIKTISPKKNNIYQQVTSLLKNSKPLIKPLKIKNKLLTELGESDDGRPYIRVLKELDKNNQIDLNKKEDKEIKRLKGIIKTDNNEDYLNIINKREYNIEYNIEDIKEERISEDINENPLHSYNKSYNKSKEVIKPNNMTTMSSNIFSQITNLITENSNLRNQIKIIKPIENEIKNITKEIKQQNTNKELIKQTNYLNELQISIKNIESSTKTDLINLKNLIEALKIFFKESIEIKEIKENNYLKNINETLKIENQTLKNENRLFNLNFDNKKIELKILKSENDNLNILIKKLPILNLYEFQIKENIEKWFKSNQKSDLINKLQNKILGVSKLCINALDILKLIENNIKEATIHFEETIKLKEETINNKQIELKHKQEIKNLKLFYEQKIQKMEKNGEEGIWSAFELSDL